MYKVLPQSEGPTLGLMISGKIDITEEQEMIELAEKVLAEHDKLNLLVIVGENVWASLEAAYADLRWITTHLKNVAKLAIVTDSKTLGWLVEQDAKIARHLGIGERHFATDELEEAWTWTKSA